MRSRRIQILAVVTLIFIGNLLFSGWVAFSRHWPGGDEAVYFDVAKNFYEGNGFSNSFKRRVNDPDGLSSYPAGHRFLYPYLCSLAFHAYGRAAIEIMILVSGFFNASLAVVVFYLAYKLYGYREGLLANLLYSFSAFYNFLGTVALADMTATFFFYACLLTFLKYLISKWPPWILLGGIFWTLAFLTREETILLGLFVIVIALLSHSSIKHIFWLLFPFVPAFALRTYYLYRAFGSFHLNVQSLWRLPYWEQFYSLEPFSLSQYLSYVGGIGGAIQIRVFNFLTFARNFCSDGLFLDSDTGTLPLIAIPVLMLAYLRRMERKRRIFVIGFSVFGVLMTLVILAYPGYAETSARTRHAQLIGPFLLIMSSAGLLGLWSDGLAVTMSLKRIRAFGLINYLRWTLAALFVASYVFMCFTFLTVNLDRWVFRRPFMADLRQAAEWGETHLPPTATIMTRKPEIVHYYSKLTAIVPPLTDFATIMLYAERNEVTHVVISSQERDWRPNILPGILARPANFRLVYEGRGAQIYEVLSYDFGLKEPHRAEYDQYLDGYENPHRPFSWEDLSGLLMSVLFVSFWQ